MSSGDVNKYVEDVLTESVLKPDRKAFYYSEANTADFDNGSCCSTTAQNSSELSLETTNSTSKVTTSAAVVSEDEFDGNVYEALVKSGEMGYNKSEFNIPTNLDENLYDFEQNGLNVTNNLNKGSRLNFNKNTLNVHRTKSRDTLDNSTTLDKSTTLQEHLHLTQQLERSGNMDFELDKDQEDKFKLLDLTNNKTTKTVNVINDSDKPNTTKVVGDVYFFLLQMKLLNTLDLVRSVCKPWGVPPFGNDYVFHFDQIVNSTLLGLLQRYEEIFTPIYSKFSSGNPKLLWTKVEDVDYFKIVYQLECLRFNQPFVSSIYDNILRYTVTKLDDSENTNLLESLHGNYLDNNSRKNSVCSYCGNLFKGDECKYCVDSLENTPIRKTIISQINVEEDNNSNTSTVDTKDSQDRCQLTSYMDKKNESKRGTLGEMEVEEVQEFALNKDRGENVDVEEVGDKEDVYQNEGFSEGRRYEYNRKDSDKSDEMSEMGQDDLQEENENDEDSFKRFNEDYTKQPSKEDKQMVNEVNDNKYESNNKEKQENMDMKNESKVNLDTNSSGFDMSMLKGNVNGLKFNKNNGFGYMKNNMEEYSLEYTRKFNNFSKNTRNYSENYFGRYNRQYSKNEPNSDLIDEWPGDLKQVDSDSPFTLTNYMDVRNEDDFYSLFNEDISNSFVCSPGSGSLKSAEETNKDNEFGNKVDSPGVMSSGNKENIVETLASTVDLEKVAEFKEGLIEEVDLTTTNSMTSSNNNTRLISTDNVDNSEVDVTTNSNVDFSENFLDNTKFQIDVNNSTLEKTKFDESFVDQDSSYAILDENILSTINEELLNISDEDILEEQYLNKGNQDIEKIILSVLNRKLTAHFNKYQDNKYNDYVENAGYLSTLYPNYPYNSQPLVPQVTNKYNNPKFAAPKYKNNYLGSYMEDAYRNMDKYAYVENKYAHMENRYNYIEYPNNPMGNREKKRVKVNRDPDYQYPYSSYKDLYKDPYKTYMNKDKPKERFREKEEKKRKRRLNSDSMSSNISNQSDSYANGYGSYKDRDKEIKISSHVVSASVSYDKRQQRFMAQWKTKEGTKHSKSFYAKRYATPIMARKHAELYKMYILQHRVMNANDLVEPTYEQLLANNFKDLDAVNVGELDYEL